MTPVVAALAAVVGFGGAISSAPAPEPTRQVRGVLEEVDFIHRTGRFRDASTGSVRDFILLPSAAVYVWNAEADLRDLTPGTACEFTLQRDPDGRFTRVVTLRDRFTVDARHGDTHWDTHWLVGPTVRKRAAEEQRRAYTAFVKARGLAGRVERTSGRTLTVALFGDPDTFASIWSKEFVPDRDVHVAVANEELRTWNPPVDNERARMNAVEVRPAVEPGFSGVRLTVTVNFMLEGFRKGRVVRVFGPGWRVQDQPFGEQLFHYGARHFPPDLAENPAKEYPDQYPFRTDYSNAHLPWYRIKAGVTPPPDSEHRIYGELLSVGADHRSGRFRLEDSRDEVEFALIPGGTVRALNAEADLGDIPVGTRCRFHLYQDDTGAFRRASFVTDEVSDLVKTGAVWRIESLNLAAGHLIAPRQPPGVKNDQGDPEQPPDVGRALLRVDANTRVWKGDKPVKLTNLAVGDLLLVNRTGERAGQPSRCADVWVGAETHKQFTDPQRRKAAAPK
ncbi:hypothetical protein [Fimbriiglobus ruber]|uniref:Uncharacterized protein n=1 Tax=Fimbriiglobus ruber TaxID=1908690 RepID=A0A225E7G2_9BACT|nr:hypothetical protein [Fimbriiglobus ruber]OWK45449.1 hypothetical protein FRUB_01780 [Fimbriiglobus ruber]